MRNPSPMKIKRGTIPRATTLNQVICPGSPVFSRITLEKKSCFFCLFWSLFRTKNFAFVVVVGGGGHVATRARSIAASSGDIGKVSCSIEQIPNNL